MGVLPGAEPCAADGGGAEVVPGHGPGAPRSLRPRAARPRPARRPVVPPASTAAGS